MWWDVTHKQKKEIYYEKAYDLKLFVGKNFPKMAKRKL